MEVAQVCALKFSGADDYLVLILEWCSLFPSVLQYIPGIDRSPHVTVIIKFDSAMYL